MLTKRHLLALMGSAAIGAAATGQAAVAQDRPFTFVSWGGALSDTEQKAFMDPASKELGIDIVNASPTNYAKIKAMVEANAVEWDLVDVGGQFIYQGMAQDLLEPLDYDVIDTSKIDPAWVTPYGVFTSTGATVIAYNTDKFPEGKQPKSWADFWNVEEFPGPRSLYGKFYYNYEAALRAAGAPCDEIYPATDEKVQQAFDKLREIKPNVAVWWTSGAQPAQLLATGEVVMASAWSGRVLDVMKENAPVSLTYKDAIAWGNAYVVPKGSPYKDEAMKVINFALTEGAQEALLPLGTYGPVLASAAEKATPEQAKMYVSYPDNMADACIFNDEEVAKYVTKYEEEWKKFQLE